ncbi:MAG: hypothetical protein HQL34_08985 [Alphaproteobacteria bacterium]|nr:hypothetical protein [Alphaproteobacteria bacterium]
MLVHDTLARNYQLQDVVHKSLAGLQSGFERCVGGQSTRRLMSPKRMSASQAHGEDAAADAESRTRMGGGLRLVAGYGGARHRSDPQAGGVNGGTSLAAPSTIRFRVIGHEQSSSVLDRDEPNGRPRSLCFREETVPFDGGHFPAADFHPAGGLAIHRPDEMTKHGLLFFASHGEQVPNPTSSFPSLRFRRYKYLY